MRWLLLFSLNFLVINLVAMAILLSENGNQELLRKISKLKYMAPQMEIHQLFGEPMYKDKEQWVYFLSDNDRLLISWRDRFVLDAVLRTEGKRDFDSFKIADDMVIVDRPNSFSIDRPKTFLIGIPEKGQVFEVGIMGRLESISWIRPWKSSKDRGPASVLIKENIKKEMVYGREY